MLRDDLQVSQIQTFFLTTSPLCAHPPEIITDNQIEIGQLKADLKDKVMYTLLRKHRHQTKKSNLRSLADIGKTVSSASRLFSNQENGNTDASLVQSSLFINVGKKLNSFSLFIFLISSQDLTFVVRPMSTIKDPLVPSSP